jgi:hypothetical protein
MSYRPSLLLFGTQPYSLLFNRLVGPVYSLNTPSHKTYVNKYYYYNKDGDLPTSPIADKKWNVGENFLIFYLQGSMRGSVEWVIMAFDEWGESTFTTEVNTRIDVLDGSEAVIGTLGGWSYSTSWVMEWPMPASPPYPYHSVHSNALTSAFTEYDGPIHGIVIQEDVDEQIAHTPQAMILPIAWGGRLQVGPGPLKL